MYNCVQLLCAIVLLWGTSSGVGARKWQGLDAGMCMVVASCKHLCIGRASRECVQLWGLTTAMCMLVKTETGNGDWVGHAWHWRLVVSLHTVAGAILFCIIVVKYNNGNS